MYKRGEITLLLLGISLSVAAIGSIVGSFIKPDNISSSRADNTIKVRINSASISSISAIISFCPDHYPQYPSQAVYFLEDRTKGYIPLYQTGVWGPRPYFPKDQGGDLECQEKTLTVNLAPKYMLDQCPQINAVASVRFDGITKTVPVVIPPGPCAPRPTTVPPSVVIPTTYNPPPPTSQPTPAQPTSIQPTSSQPAPTPAGTIDTIRVDHSGGAYYLIRGNNCSLAKEDYHGVCPAGVDCRPTADERIRLFRTDAGPRNITGVVRHMGCPCNSYGICDETNHYTSVQVMENSMCFGDQNSGKNKMECTFTGQRCNFSNNSSTSQPGGSCGAVQPTSAPAAGLCGAKPWQLTQHGLCSPACCNTNNDCSANGSPGQSCSIGNGECKTGKSCDPNSGRNPVPSVTNPPPPGGGNTATGAITGNSCTLSANQTQCTIGLQWTTENASNVTVRVENYQGEIIGTGASGSNPQAWVDSTGANFALFSGETLLDKKFFKANPPVEQPVIGKVKFNTFINLKMETSSDRYKEISQAGFALYKWNGISYVWQQDYLKQKLDNQIQFNDEINNLDPGTYRLEPRIKLATLCGDHLCDDQDIEYRYLDCKPQNVGRKEENACEFEITQGVGTMNTEVYPKNTPIETTTTFKGTIKILRGAENIPQTKKSNMFLYIPSSSTNSISKFELPAPLKNNQIYPFEFIISKDMTGIVNYGIDFAQADTSDQSRVEITDGCPGTIKTHYGVKVYCSDIPINTKDVNLVFDLTSNSPPDPPPQNITYPRRLGPGRVINKNVLLLIYKPFFSTANKSIIDYYNWNNPDILTARIINWFKEVSGNKMIYTIKERMEITDFTEMKNGYKFNETDYIHCEKNQNPINCHEKLTDGSDNTWDYGKAFAQLGICEGQAFDEVWVWGGPWFGFYEARMAGPGSWFTNGPVLEGTSCQKPVHIMGFNYAVGFDQAIHSMGHRVEGTIETAFNNQGGIPRDHWISMNGFKTDFDKFWLAKRNDLHYSACGNIHYTPNSLNGGIFDDKTPYSSSCDDFYNFPNIKNPDEAQKKNVNGDTWGNSQENFFAWWFDHLPPLWWEYAFDVRKFRADIPTSIRAEQIENLDIIQDGVINRQDYKQALSFMKSNKNLSIQGNNYHITAKALANIANNMGKQLWHRHY